MSDILSDWTNQHSLLLIHEYRKYPVLWNSRHKYHFNKNRKQDAWQNIASVCRASVEEVRKKMQSLLGSFRREKKKMHRIAANTKETPNSKWFAYKSLMFLCHKSEHARRAIKTEPAILKDEQIDALSSSVSVPPDDVPVAACLGVELNFPKTEPEEAENCQPEESTAIYAQYVAHKLGQFSGKSRSLLEYRINRLIFQAEMDKHNEEENSSSFQDYNQPFNDPLDVHLMSLSSPSSDSAIICDVNSSSAVDALSTETVVGAAGAAGPLS